jgi:hypothetical protein
MPTKEEEIEQQQVQPQPQPQPNTNEWLDKVNELKKNYVPKSDYEKIKADYDDLANKVLNGEDLSGSGETAEKTDAKKRMYEIAGIFEDAEKVSNMSNLDYWKLALEQRKLMIEEGIGDPFLPNLGKSVDKGANITQFDIDRANAVGDKMQELVQQANGDNEYFNALLNKAID